MSDGIKFTVCQKKPGWNEHLARASLRRSKNSGGVGETVASQYQYSRHISSKITLHLEALSIASMNPPKKTLVVIQRKDEILMCRVQLHQSSHDNHIVDHA